MPVPAEQPSYFNQTEQFRLVNQGVEPADLRFVQLSHEALVDGVRTNHTAWGELVLSGAPNNGFHLRVADACLNELERRNMRKQSAEKRHK